MGNSYVLPLFGWPSPDDFLQGFVEALQRMFGATAQDAIARALFVLSEHTPSLDLSNRVLDRYDGMFAVALALGALASAIQLLRAIKMQEWSSFIDFAKIVPLTFMFGAVLPYATYLMADVIGDIHRNIVQWILDRPLDGATFDFTVTGNFNAITLPMGWLGASVLQVESFMLVQLMPHLMLVLILAFALRWFGVLGDGLFTFTVGLFFTMLFGTTAMVLVLSIFFLGANTAVFQASYISLAIFVTALMPLLIFVAYFKFGFSQRVKGVMDTRLISSRISVRSRGTDEGGSGLASKVVAAGVGAVAGALIARETGGGRPEGVSMTDHQRDKTAGRLMMAATMMSRSHPVTSVAMLYGSKLLQTKPKPSDKG